MQLPEPYPSLVNHLAHPTPRGRFQLLSFKHFAYPPPRSKVQLLPLYPSFSSFTKEQDLFALFRTIFLILLLGVGFICSLLTHLAQDPSPRSRFQLLSFKPPCSSFSQEQGLFALFQTIMLILLLGVGFNCSFSNHLAHPSPRSRFSCSFSNHLAHPSLRSRVQLLPFKPSCSSFSKEQDLVALFQTILLILLLGVGFSCSLSNHLAHPSPRSWIYLLFFKPSCSSFSQEQGLVALFQTILLILLLGVGFSQKFFFSKIFLKRYQFYNS